MAKLVVLTEGFTGLSHELKGEKVTIGRVEDNVWQIAEQSISSHHCELTPKGEELAFKDLGSTNGSFINGEQVTEGVLKPGQVLRLGQVEIRYETGVAAAGKKALEKTVVLPQGVRVQEFEQGKGGTVSGATGFQKKSNKTNRVFIGIGVALGVIILIILVLAATKMM
jgi:pSer/pThr/pTyr-binding forkhead associated (FHA) protein